MKLTKYAVTHRLGGIVKGKKIIVKMLSSYLVVLLIPLIVVYIVYSTAVTAITASSEDQAVSMLNQMNAIVDTRAQELQSITRYVMDNQDILSAATSQRISPYSPDIFLLYKACNNIPLFSETNLLLEDTFVLLTKHEYLLSRGTASKYNEQEHEALFNGCGYHYETFKENAASQYYRNRIQVFPGNDGASVYLLNSISQHSFDVQAVVILKINMEYLRDLLRDSQPYQYCRAYITDENGIAIAEYNTLSDADKDALAAHPDSQFISYSVYSSVNGWGYHYTIPKKIIFAETARINEMVLILAIVALLIGVSIGFMSTRSKASALVRILTYLGISQAELSAGSEYSAIEQAVDGLVREHQVMDELVRQQRPLMNAAILRRLLLPGMEPPQPDQLRAVNIDLDDRVYAVAIIQVEPVLQSPFDIVTVDYNHIAALIKTRFIAEMGENVHFLDLDNSHAAAVFLYDKPGPDIALVKRTISSIHDMIIKEENLQLFYCLSELYSGVNQARRAFDEARRISRWFVAKKGQSLYTKIDMPLHSSKFYYPIDMEIRLIQTARRGDTDVVKEILEEVYEENFNKRILSESMKHQLINAMRSTIARGLKDLAENSDIDDILLQMDGADTIDSIFNCFIRAHISVSQQINQRKRPTDTNLEKRIIAFIQENYGNADLTIHSVSAHFQMKEQQLYYFFRDIIGQTYADYLEGVRIQAACRLLREGTVTIKEIAQMTGYTSDVSFRRAFKRVISLSPSEYMKAL